jgi:hypothetical protein
MNSTIVARLFIKRPDPVEAIQLTLTNINFLANWCGGTKVQSGTPGRQYYGSIDIPVDNVIVTARLGDYITKNAEGIFDSVTADQFDRDYKPEGVRARLARLKAANSNHFSRSHQLN